MAKTQTFGDKSKSQDTTIHVKVVKGFHSEKGTTKYVTRFVKVADVAQVDKIDICNSQSQKNTHEKGIHPNYRIVELS